MLVNHDRMNEHPLSIPNDLSYYDLLVSSAWPDNSANSTHFISATNLAQLKRRLNQVVIGFSIKEHRVGSAIFQARLK
jgi:hypothetical protein